MSYFKKVKEGDLVFGLIFGRGVVTNVLSNSYYLLFVEFENGIEVAYTIDGIPNWGNFEEQTLFYREDVCLEDIDFSPLDKVLSKKKIIKLREKNKLEVRLYSGIWKNIKLVEDSFIQDLLEKENYHLFRKKK